MALDKGTLAARAEELGRLHGQSGTLVLPTIWDAWSARTAVAAGFEALTIGSHPLADSRGAKDAEGQSFSDVVAAAKLITASVDVPVSIDLESGYGQTPDDLIAGLLEAGGVGPNVEDTVHSEGDRVRTTEEHAAYVAGLRAAADAAGVPVWINGRTDLFVHADDPAAALGAVIERLHAMVAAGSNSVYPVAIHDNDELISAVVAAVDVPVNITAFPERHDLHRFVRLGVRRVTYGPFLQFALTEAMTSLLTPWRG